MAVHAWDEVYGYKFATKINQSMEMWRLQDQKASTASW
jgi:hypothetical protein